MAAAARSAGSCLFGRNFAAAIEASAPLASRATLEKRFANAIRGLPSHKLAIVRPDADEFDHHFSAFPTLSLKARAGAHVNKPSSEVRRQTWKRVEFHLS